ARNVTGVQTCALPISELNIPFQDSGLFTRKSFLAQHPATVENVLRALVESIAFIQAPDNKTAVLKSLAQWLRLPKPDDALEGYRSEERRVGKSGGGGE